MPLPFRSEPFNDVTHRQVDRRRIQAKIAQIKEGFASC